jgi:hypothetical protein
MGILLFGASLFLGIANGGQTAPPFAYPVESSLEGPDSPKYTAWVLNALRSWPVARLVPRQDENNPIEMRCLRTSQNERYVGARQSMWIRASLGEVASVIRDYEHYKDLSPGFVDIRVLSRDHNKAVLYWEKRTPTFLIPNVRYEMTYLVDESSRDRVVFRYKLKESKHLRNADGFIVLEKEGEKLARFTRYDFIDPTRGVFNSAPVGLIWKNTLEDIYLSNAGIKLKAEHPLWTFEQVVSKSEELLKTNSGELDSRNCLREF